MRICLHLPRYQCCREHYRNNSKNVQDKEKCKKLNPVDRENAVSYICKATNKRQNVLGINEQSLGSGCGPVGSAVASNSRGLQFKTSHRQKLYWVLYWKDENKEKEAGNDPFQKNLTAYLQTLLEMGRRRPLLVYFCSFRTWQLCNKKVIRRFKLTTSWIINHHSPPITTRPGTNTIELILPYYNCCKIMATFWCMI